MGATHSYTVAVSLQLVRTFRLFRMPALTGVRLSRADYSFAPICIAGYLLGGALLLTADAVVLSNPAKKGTWVPRALDFASYTILAITTIFLMGSFISVIYKKFCNRGGSGPTAAASQRGRRRASSVITQTLPQVEAQEPPSYDNFALEAEDQLPPEYVKTAPCNAAVTK